MVQKARLTSISMALTMRQKYLSSVETKNEYEQNSRKKNNNKTAHSSQEKVISSLWNDSNIFVSGIGSFASCVDGAAMHTCYTSLWTCLMFIYTTILFIAALDLS